jgi:hypothetical protein
MPRERSRRTNPATEVPPPRHLLAALVCRTSIPKDLSLVGFAIPSPGPWQPSALHLLVCSVHRQAAHAAHKDP